MQQFSAAQLALIASGLIGQEASDSRYRQLGVKLKAADVDLTSLATLLNNVYRRLDQLIAWEGIDQADAVAALNLVYRRLDEAIVWADLDSASVLTALNLVYRRLDQLISWNQLDSASVYAALDPRYAPTSNFKIRNYPATVTGLTLELPSIPTTLMDPQVFINGLLNATDFYTISDSTVTFTAALAGDAVQIIYSEAII